MFLVKTFYSCSLFNIIAIAVTVYLIYLFVYIYIISFFIYFVNK